jgi:hypothetical protein
MRHPSAGRLLAASALLVGLALGCADRRAVAGVEEGPAVPGPALAVPGVPDALQGRTVYFTRRLGPSGETVALRFTPAEITSRGRVVGELVVEGRQLSGTVAGAAATLGFDREGGSCGRVTLAFEPVRLPASPRETALAPVAVDLARAGRPGRLAAALCTGATDLAATLRRLVDDLLPRADEPPAAHP